MLFATNRVLNEGPTPRSGNTYLLPRSISFALSNNQAEQAVYFCQRNGRGDYIEIGNQAFFSELKAANYQQLLLFLHGFNSIPEPDIFPKVQELQTFFDQKAPNEVLVVPLIWPCDNDFGVVKDYFDDQKAADASDIAFMRLFEKFLAWRDDNSTLENPCIKRINVLAHSMGNRVLRGALNRTVQYYQPQGVSLLFRNTFLASADLVNEALEPSQEAQFIPPASRNVVVYHAADDFALRSSKVANVGTSGTSPRLGHTGPENMDRVPRNVVAIDCADFNNEYDPPLGHNYFDKDRSGAPGLMFEHMWECIRTGRVPVEIRGDRTQVLDERFWNR
ncbi:alpha/beta hydrolase [Oculatella sp. LEGE 06141]|uniref:alpha/beta hydrolase n=1 Tax=Oculatella sp. LEGE 06141 TaxID=1828648 RepID=UPI00187E9F64|nr:alpha/beta hydrolase [Oculatella sp. LEGE 06141]MBE9180966.1 alpha/beta hydrolase [Oculatella sp. LEGE 06141]